MRFKTIILMLVMSCFTACNLYYSIIRGESSLFSGSQHGLMEKTCSVSGYGHGYDDEMELDYFFVRDKVQAASKSIDSELRGVFRSAGEKESVAYFESIIYLSELMRLKNQYYEKIELWKHYTYINNYLLPQFQGYEALIRKAILSNYPSYTGKMEARRKEFTEQIIKELRKSNEVNLWENIR